MLLALSETVEEQSSAAPSWKTAPLFNLRLVKTYKEKALFPLLSNYVTFKDFAASWKMLLLRPVFFPWLGGWQNCIYTFNFERERDYPISQQGSSQHPTGGVV